MFEKQNMMVQGHIKIWDRVSKEVYVDNPGGSTQDEFQKTFELFFSRYFTQAFLQNSDLKYYFENPLPYKRNLKAGIMYGRSAGVRTGYNWVVRAEAV